jgi:hypothetical protein
LTGAQQSAPESLFRIDSLGIRTHSTPLGFATTLVMYSERVEDGVTGAGDETRTRDIRLARKDATARAERVFRKALDASMAHLLWLANVFLCALQWSGLTLHRIPPSEMVQCGAPPLAHPGRDAGRGDHRPTCWRFLKPIACPRP